MSKVVVPVGFDGGPMWDPEPDSDTTAPTEFDVVVGLDIVDLDRDEYRVWLFSFSDPEASSLCDFDRERMSGYAEMEFTDIEDATAVVDGLFKDGLLAEFDPEDESGINFLKSYRMYPTGDSMGNDGAERHYYRIGREGRVLVKVMWDIYAIWKSAPYFPSLWDVLVEYHGGITEPLLDLNEMAQLLAASVPGIVTNRCAYLQKR